jgi:hypothetical protein
MSGTKTMWSSPYREPSIPEEPFTDAEMHLWDKLVCAVANKTNGVSTAEKIANFADAMLKERRKRHGMR